ncbi:MAG TPA: pyridoxal phosphate-dependent aminotransferase [Bacteroidota bacterium]|nr:pyridoxal phosphate-dependent aminotransferase [Bacteroidota bacterium]
MKSLSRQVAKAEPSMTLAMSAIAKKLKAEGVDVVTLTAGEPDFPTPFHIKRAAISAIENNYTGYTINAGIVELRKAIADKFKRDNNLSFDPSQILVSNGAKHSIYNALKAICNKGDEVIIPAPYWVTYPEMVKLVDAVPVIINTTEANDFKMTPVQLKRAITKKTKALLFCSPSNPTGTVYSQEEIEALAKVTAKADLYVISDEIYEKVIYDGAKHFSIGSIPDVRDHVITVNGVSKAFSMTGWRIGYLGAKKEIVDAAEKVQSQVTSNASSISQHAALAALTGSDDEVNSMASEFLRRRNFIYDAVTSIEGITCAKPKGAFYIFPNLSGFIGKKAKGKTLRSGDDIAQYLLDEERVVIVPGSGFGAKNYARISYACSMQELEKAAVRMTRGFKRLNGN